jgi:formylglycine-generating enzyme required for sulfatase activity
VTLSPFFLSKYEMTQGQWSRFTGSNPSAYDRERYHKYWNARGEEWTSLHPVERVNWWACSIALDRLGLQLPTEAQWEYGSRAGTSTVFWCGDEKESLRGVANLLDSYAKSHGSEIYNLWEPWLDDGQTQHASVGSYAPNAFGLHDVIGNVWEWCWDGYSESFYSQSSSKDPLCDPAALSPRVYRGGSFASVASGARSADRLGGSPEFAGGALGVRPARRISP